MKEFALTAAFFVVISGCGGETPSVTTAVEPDTLELLITDTLGVLMGDSTLMFGSVSGATLDPQGNLLVLDGIKAQISVFSPELELLRVIGGKGSGPGEFQYPRYFALMEDGGLAVSDWGVNTVTLFDAGLEYLNSLENFFPVAPGFIVPAAGGGFVGGGMQLTPADNQVGYEGSTFVGLWREGTEPSVIYREFPLDISVNTQGEEVNVNVDNVDAVFESDVFGNVYVTVRSDSTYLIERYAPSGELNLTIERDWERIAKTEEEMEMEFLEESHSRHDDGSTTARQNYRQDTYPWHNSIFILRTDDQGNLWVGQGYTPMPVFHVYDPEGELTSVVTIPELEGVRGVDYCFRNGMIAFDYAPEDYPKIYLLSESAR